MSVGFSCPSSLLGERYASPHIGGSADCGMSGCNHVSVISG